MSGTGGPLNYNATLSREDFLAGITAMERRLMGLTNTARNESKKVDDTFSRLGKVASGYFAFDTLKQLPLELIKVRGEVQQVEIAFSTMLRDQGKAKELLRENFELAAKSPFEFRDVVQASKQLLAYGSDSRTVVKEVAMLGDVAAGVSQPLGDLIYLYGTLRAQGRAYAVDIKQFAGRGLPIFSELAKVLKINVDRVQEFVTAGKVGFKEVEQAFKNMTSTGGQFENLGEKQNKSLTGLLSNLKDEIYRAVNDIGEANEGILNSMIKSGISVVQNYDEILKIIKVLTAAYGAYKAAVLITVAVQSLAASTTAGWTVLEALHFRALLLVEGAQKALNRTMLANPYVLAATALVGLIAAVVVYNDELDATEKAEKAITDARNTANNAASEEIAKTRTLADSINNEKLSREERNKKLQELIALSPEHLKSLTLENIKTGQGTDAINNYVDALKRKLEYQEIEKELTASIQRQNDIKSGKDDLNYFQKVGVAISSGAATQSMSGPSTAAGASTSYAAGIKRANQERLAEEDTFQQKILDRKRKLEETNAAALKGEKTTQKAAARTVEWYDQQIKSLREQQSQTATNSAQYATQQKEIEKYEKARRRITGEQTSAEKRAAKQADKAGAVGSLAYYEEVARKADEIIKKTAAGDTARITAQRKIRDNAQEQADLIRRGQEQVVGSLAYYEGLISKANDVLSKTPETDTAAIALQQQVITENTAKAEALRKQITVKSFSEGLAEKKKQYDQYQLLVDALGQTAADAQFADLKKNGANYVDYLTAEIAKLQAAAATGPLSKADSEKLTTLTAEKDDATGKKQRIDLFTESLAKARAEAGSLTDYLAILKQKQDELGDENTPFALAARRQVADQTVATQADRTAGLREFLQSVQGSEAQRTAITKKYADLRAEIEKQAKAGIITDYAERLTAVTNAQREETEAVERSTAEQSNQYKELSKVVNVEGRKAIELRIQRLRDYLTYLEGTAGKESELYKAVALELRGATRDLQADTLNTINVIAGLGGQLGEVFAAAGGVIGEVGGLMSGLASQAKNVTVAFDENASATDKLSAGVSGAIGLVDILVGSANERRKAEEEYYRSAIAFQQQYNVALNDQIGLQTQLRENVFVKDQEGRLRDGIKQLGAAQIEYQKSLAALSGGRAKTGQGTVVDGKKIGAGIGSGAALGAAIGSAVPIIGTAIGAVGGAIVGGLVGLFGGGKKQDQFTGLLEKYPDLVKGGANGWAAINKELATALINQNQVDDATKQLLQNTLEWQAQLDKAQAQIRGVISEVAGGLGSTLRDALVGAFEDGTDSAQAFGDSVGKILGDMLNQIAFNQIFSKQFDQLQAEMEASYGVGGDQSWVDDIGRFYQTSVPLVDKFNEAMKAAQDAAGQYGLDVFKKSDTTATRKPGASNAIQGITEQQAGVLEGQANAVRITLATMEVGQRQQLFHMANIDTNTASMDRKMDMLTKIYDALKSGSGRGLGL